MNLLLSTKDLRDCFPKGIATLPSDDSMQGLEKEDSGGS